MPPSFWAKALPRVRAAYPDAWFVGEVIHGDYLAYAKDSGLDSVTQYELWKAIWSSLNDRNFFELAWTLDRHNQLLVGVTPQTFLGNHDVTRLASQLNDERHIGHALAVLFTVGGQSGEQFSLGSGVSCDDRQRVAPKGGCGMSR